MIPYTYVSFTLNLDDPEFVNLNSTFGSVTVNASTNNWKYSGGFNNNGIIIFNGGGQFYAYDRTCPYDYAINNINNARVNIVDLIYAECPICKTRYVLANFGTPTSDTIGRYPLKNYRTTIYGNSVIVSNY